jgi:hypothetical protein
MVCEKPLEEFTCFPKLPIELRFRIYTFIASDKALITAECGIAIYKRMDAELRDGMKSATRGVPVVLHICKESREEFLSKMKPKTAHRTYTLCKNITLNKASNNIYVSLEEDTLVLTNIGKLIAAATLTQLVYIYCLIKTYHPLDPMFCPDIRTLRNLALTMEMTKRSMVQKQLVRFNSLEKLSIMISSFEFHNFKRRPAPFDSNAPTPAHVNNTTLLASGGQVSSYLSALASMTNVWRHLLARWRSF